MSDLIDLIVTGRATPAAVADHVARVRAAAGGGDRRLVAAAEAELAADPSRLTFDAAGHATLATAGHTWAAGRFQPVSIGTLKGRLAGNPGGRARLFVMDGASPITDIAALQATAGPGTLFQVASQFNCLESPGPYLTPVARYFTDPTQGPRASVSALPGTLLRHYAAPGDDGVRCAQSDHRQIELLADALGSGSAPNGYFTGEGVPDAAARLAVNFDQIRVGLHDGVDVVLGGNWDGGVDGPHRIAQAFTSTVAGGMYGGRHALGREPFAAAATQLLRAAYLGTLLGSATVGCRRVVLTMIGGGVFANPAPLILDAIAWALDAADPLLPGPTDVVLNGYNLGPAVAGILPTVHARGGTVHKL